MFVGKLKIRKDFVDVREFFLNGQDETVVKLNFLFFVIGDKVWRNKASVESHTIDEFSFVMKGLTFLNCYGSVNSDFFVQVSQKVSDFSVTIG